jgi:hypothetical protein
MFFQRTFIFFDKNSLSDGISIKKVQLCVNTKAITRYGLRAGVPSLRKIRAVDQEETGGKWEG